MTASNTEMNSYLRQEFVGSEYGFEATKVRVFLQENNLPAHLSKEELPQREIILDINKDYSGQAVI